MVTSAWAGASLLPAGNDAPALPKAAPAAVAQASTSATARRTSRAAAARSEGGAQPAPEGGASFDAGSLPDGEVLAGAAKTSIEPQPAKYGGTWQKDHDLCATLSESSFSHGQEFAEHLATAGSPWPENPDCIYMGGFGIGPMNPVSSWNQDLGLWIRALALRDRQGDDLVMAIIDGEGYFWDYAHKCTDCGIKQITQTLADDPSLGLKPENIIIAATHAHSSPDFIGGWGFVPDWYMKQVSETIKSTIKDAIASERPAVLEYGEEMARPYNHERRDSYRSAEEQQIGWLRAHDPAGEKLRGQDHLHDGRLRRASHDHGTNNGQAHPTGPGASRRASRTSSGHRSPVHDRPGQHVVVGWARRRAGRRQAQPLIPLRGTRVANPTSRTTRTTWQQPVTNVPLTTLGEPGFFDRKFAQTRPPWTWARTPRSTSASPPRRPRRRSPPAPRRSARSPSPRRPARSSPTPATPSRRTRTPRSRSRSGRPTTRSATCRSRSR